MDEKAVKEIIAEFEMRGNAAIARVLSVNDNYGTEMGRPILRAAVLEEINGLMRFHKQCLSRLLSPTSGNGRTPTAAQTLSKESPTTSPMR